MRRRAVTLLALTAGLLHPQLSRAGDTGADAAYSFPAPERVFVQPDTDDAPPVLPAPLVGVPALSLLESNPAPRDPGFLPGAWGQDLSVRRRLLPEGGLLRLLDEPDSLSRIPFRREESFVRAEALLHARRWAEAADAFGEFAGSHPADTLLSYALVGWGEAAYRAGRRDEAGDAFLRAWKAAATAPVRWMAGRSAAWIRREQGDTAAARTTLESLLAEGFEPERRNHLLLDLAELELAAGRAERCRELLEPWTAAMASGRIEDWDPRGFMLLAWSGAVRGEWDRTADAMDAVLRTRRAPPEEWIAQAHSTLGWINLGRGDTERARMHYRRSVPAGEEEGARNAYGLALALQRDGDLASALETLDGWAGPVPADLAWQWSYARGFILFQLGRYAEVPPSLAAALEAENPDTLRYHATVLLGDARWRQRLLEDALDSYRTAAGLTRDSPEELLWRRAVVALDLGRWGESARALKDALTRFPGSRSRGDYAFWRAEALYRLGRYAESEESYQLALRAGYPAGRVHYGLGWCADVRGRFEDAAAQFGAALLVGLDGPQAADAALRRGHALSNLHRWDDADAAYEEAARLGRGTPTKGQARFRRAWLEMRRGRPAEAAARWERLSTELLDQSLAAHAIYWAAQARFSAASYESALRLFRQAQERGRLPDSLRYAAALGAADALYNLERWGDAKKAYQDLLGQGAAPRTVRAAAADGIYNTLVLDGRWDEAQSFVESITRAFPEIAREGERHLRIADGFLEEGQLEKAARAYESLASRADLSPSITLRAWIGFARSLEAAGRWKDAAAKWEQAGWSAGRERRGVLWMDAARLYVRAESWLDVVRILEELRGERLEVDEPWRVPLQLAQAYDRLERMDAAAGAWRDVAEQAPGDTLRAKAWASVGRLAVKAQDWEEALSAYTRVEELEALGAIYRPLYWKGEALYKMERYEEAEAAFAAFLTDPPEEALWEGMTRMRRAACLEEMKRWDDALSEYDLVLGLKDRGLGESLLDEAALRRRQVEAWSDSTGGTGP